MKERYPTALKPFLILKKPYTEKIANLFVTVMKKHHTQRGLQAVSRCHVRVIPNMVCKQSHIAIRANKPHITMREPHPKRRRARWVPSMRATGVKGSLVHTSPMAKMLGTVVVFCASTLTLPLSSSSTPTCTPPPQLRGYSLVTVITAFAGMLGLCIGGRVRGGGGEERSWERGVGGVSGQLESGLWTGK